MFAPSLFENKIILVSGGRSGIGFAIAKAYLQYGAQVFIASRKKELLEKAAEKLKQYGQCHAVTCDIRSTEDIEALAQTIEETTGHLDILVNNAGGQFPAPAHIMAEKGWATIINNNLNGTFYMCQKMANRFFIPQNSGNVINITANVLRGFPGMAHTGAARAGVENLTKSLGQEWANFGIRVNAVAPGTIDTTGLDQYPPLIQETFEKMKQDNLMKRFGTAKDVANAVLFLSSPLASYISGITLAVDGLEHLSGDRMGIYKALMDMIK